MREFLSPIETIYNILQRNKDQGCKLAERQEAKSAQLLLGSRRRIHIYDWIGSNPQGRLLVYICIHLLPNLAAPRCSSAGEPNEKPTSSYLESSCSCRSQVILHCLGQVYAVDHSLSQTHGNELSQTREAVHCLSRHTKKAPTMSRKVCEPL